jgi:hypothetical protein
MDASGRDEGWVFANFGNRFNRDVLIEQDQNSQGFLSDYATYRQGFVFHDGVQDSSLAEAALRTQRNGSLILGWRGCEYDFFDRGTEHGVIPVPGVDMPNLSALVQLRTGPLTQVTRSNAAYPFDENAHYLAFLMVDGDNIEWYYHMLATPNWWGHRLRGRVPINWEISPTLHALASPVMKYFYDSATPNDYFVCSSSGLGSIFPERYPNLADYLSALGPALRDTDLSVLSVYQPDSLDLLSVSPFAQVQGVEGIIFKSYLGNYHLVQGVEFSEGVPIKPCDYAIWEGDDNGESLAREVNQLPRSPRTDSLSYSIAVVHPWTFNFTVMDEVGTAVNRFAPHVRVVTLKEMFHHLRHNFDRRFTGGVECRNLPDSIRLPERFSHLLRSNRQSCRIFLDPCQFGGFGQEAVPL